jgi:hypothetical protein
MANELVGNELRKGSGFVRKGQGFSLVFGEAWSFRVKAEDKFTSRLSVLTETPGLPRVGLLYGPLGLVCEDLTADRDEKNPIYWNVDAKFQTGNEEQKQSQEDPDNADPTSWVPVFKIDSFVTKERVLVQDRTTPTAKKPVNSAGTPFDSPLTETRSLCQFSFVQFEDASQKLKVFLDRNDTVNQSSFDAIGQIFDARTLLLEVVEAELGSYAGFAAWRVKYKVTYDPDKHDELRLDVGPYYKDGAELKRYMDDTNTFGIIGALDGTTGAKASDAATLTFRCKKEINFSSFIRTS